MGLADDSGLRPHITTLVDELDRPVSRADLLDTVIDAFAEVLGVSFGPDSLTAGEEAREQELATSFVVTG
jgi:lipoate-protein ligase A